MGKLTLGGLLWPDQLLIFIYWIPLIPWPLIGRVVFVHLLWLLRGKYCIVPGQLAQLYTYWQYSHYGCKIHEKTYRYWHIIGVYVENETETRMHTPGSMSLNMNEIMWLAKVMNNPCCTTHFIIAGKVSRYKIVQFIYFVEKSNFLSCIKKTSRITWSLLHYHILI